MSSRDVENQKIFCSDLLLHELLMCQVRTDVVQLPLPQLHEGGATSSLIKACFKNTGFLLPLPDLSLRMQKFFSNI